MTDATKRKGKGIAWGDACELATVSSHVAGEGGQEAEHRLMTVVEEREAHDGRVKEEIQSGHDAFKKKNFLEALAHYTKAGDLNEEEDILLLTHCANSQFQLKKYPECVKLYDRALVRAKQIKFGRKEIAKILVKKSVALKIGVKCSRDLDGVIFTLKEALVQHYNDSTSGLLATAEKRKKELQKEEFLKKELQKEEFFGTNLTAEALEKGCREMKSIAYEAKLLINHHDFKWRIEGIYPLNYEILQFYNQKSPSVRHNVVCEDLISIFGSHVQNAFAAVGGARVQIFGSYKMHLHSEDSDIDMRVAFSDSVKLSHQEKCKRLKDLYAYLITKGGYSPKLITEAIRVPILKANYRGIPVDITAEEDHAVRVSTIISAVKNIDGRFSTLCYLIKA